MIFKLIRLKTGLLKTYDNRLVIKKHRFKTTGCFLRKSIKHAIFDNFLKNGFEPVG